MTTAKRSGLGKNLSALLGQNAVIKPVSTPGTNPSKLPLKSIQPGKYQPRSDFSELALSELAHSIKTQGLLQPIIVRELSDNYYEIIAGERRWRACQLAGLNEVPVIIRQVDDETAMAIGLIENLQREDLNAMEQARAMERLTKEFSLTHQQIADLLAKSRASVSNFLRLLNLADEVKRLLENGDLDMGHGRALLPLNESQQSYVAQLIIAKSLSVRETEKLVQRVQKGLPEKEVKLEISKSVQSQIQNLSSRLNAAVKLKPGKAGKGSLVIQYNSADELQALLSQFEQTR